MYQNSSSDILTRLVNYATLPEKLLKLIWLNVNTRTKFPNEIVHEFRKSVEEELDRFAFSLEENVLLDELASNKKSAILMPLVDALAYRNSIRNRSVDVYTVKETYAGSILAFNITGPISRFILQRIWAMQESGIINWLHKLFDPTKILEDKPNENVKAAGIHGNILIIFVVWISGLATSVVSASFEHTWVLYKYLRGKRFATFGLGDVNIVKVQTKELKPIERPSKKQHRCMLFRGTKIYSCFKIIVFS